MVGLTCLLTWLEEPKFQPVQVLSLSWATLVSDCNITGPRLLPTAGPSCDYLQPQRGQMARAVAEKLV